LLLLYLDGTDFILTFLHGECFCTFVCVFELLEGGSSPFKCFITKRCHGLDMHIRHVQYKEVMSSVVKSVL
jgi:hypothetical protein